MGLEVRRLLGPAEPPKAVFPMSFAFAHLQEATKQEYKGAYSL